MMKRFITLALAIGLLASVLCCSGCLKRNRHPENEIKFGTFSQQERKDYINDFLEMEYGLSGEVSEVKQKQIDPFRNEDHYFATVRSQDKGVISVWVSNEGEITDTVFLLDMQPQLADYFKAILAKKIPSFKLKAYTEMRDIPTETLTNADDIQDFLINQKTFSYIRVFVDDPAIANEELLDELEQGLHFCEASVYLYVCDDLNNLDISTYDLHSYTCSRKIEKRE